MTTLILVAVVAVFRAITVLLMAVGTGAVAVTGTSWISGAVAAGNEWVRNVTTLAAEVAAIGLVAAAVAARRIPSIAEVRRDTPTGGSNHPAQIVLLAALAVAALLQLPALFAWFREDRLLLLEMLGIEPDPLRLDFFPAAILYSLPTLAAALLTLFAAMSIGGAVAARRLALRFLTAGVILQTGLWAIEFVVGRGVRDLGAAALRLMADAPPAETAGAVAWIQRHDVVARSMLPMLTALVIGYLVAWSAAFMTRSTSPVAAAAMSPSPLPSPVPMRVVGIPPVIRSGPTPFTERFYVLRLRAGWRMAGLMFGRRLIEYTVQTIPPSSRSEFSFSWATGVLRREPGGPDLLRLNAAERHDLLKRAYEVSDPATGAVIGRLLPQAADWQIVDAVGQRVAEVVQSSASFQQTSYVITAGGEELCRLAAVMGATAARAEVQIEFLPASDGRLERSLAIALAPIIEERARRARWT